MNGEKKSDKETLERSIGKRKQIALLGGAFDPPTLGHVAIARFVLDNLDIEQVWLAPCYRHMFNKNMSSANDRLTMLGYATRSNGRVKICDYEIQNKLGGETYHFLKSLLASEFAQTHEFSYIIGMDNANHLNRWVNFEELERLIRFVVVPRVGEEVDSSVDWYLKPPHIFLRSDQPLPDTASSRVRKDVSRTTEMLDPRVLEYIERKGLYIKQD